MLKKIVMLLVCLLTAVAVGSYAYMLELKEKLTKGNISQSQWQALSSIVGEEKGRQYLLALKQQQKITAWVNLATLIAKNDENIALQLAEYYQATQQMHAMKLWFKQAMRLGSQSARLKLATWYFQQNQYRQSFLLLLPIKHQPQAIALLFEIALLEGDQEFIAQHFASLNNKHNANLYNQLLKYRVFDLAPVEELDGTKLIHASIQPQLCPLSVQLFATSLATLKLAERLKQQFTQHRLAEFLCLNTPRYISAKALQCRHQKGERINCEQAIWDSYGIDSRYLGVIVEQGGANVDSGILYLDKHDSFDVFVHELSHLLGFIDEYPLPSSHIDCAQQQQSPFAHNVAVLAKYYRGDRKKLRQQLLTQIPWAALIKATTPILMPTSHADRWQLGTSDNYKHELGVFAAETCKSNINLQAVKPVFRQTKLQYFEYQFPQRYIDIYRLAPTKFLMSDFNFNVQRAKNIDN